MEEVLQFIVKLVNLTVKHFDSPDMAGGSQQMDVGFYMKSNRTVASPDRIKVSDLAKEYPEVKTINHFFRTYDLLYQKSGG